MHWWEDRLFAGIARFAAEHDWELDCRMRWTRTELEKPTHPCDGLIVNVGLKNTLQPFAAEMHEAGVAVVGTRDGDDYACDARVTVPHAAVGRVGARHLLDLSFAHLIFVCFADNAMERRRGEGFTAEAAAAGHRALHIPREEFLARLSALPRPMGVMAANDLNAIELMRACLDAGIHVPDECAIVGVDDTEMLCRFAPVTLTSVNCNFEEQGYLAARTLAELMAGRTPPRTNIEVVPAGVTRRRSTDTLVLTDPATSRALNFLRAHFREPIGIAEVSAGTDTPLRKLQASFRRHVGRTMIEELTRLRIERARLLLTSFQFKIDEIATECGFANRFHLARAFHRVTGLTPTEYRAQSSASSSAVAVGAGRSRFLRVEV